MKKPPGGGKGNEAKEAAVARTPNAKVVGVIAVC